MLYTISIVGSNEMFEKLRSDWDCLIERIPTRSIFLTWEWQFNWWKHFGQGGKVYILLVKKKPTEDLVGIVPLYISHKGLAKKICFIGSHTTASDFLDILVMPEHKDAIISAIADYVVANRQVWDVIELSDMEPNADAWNLIEKLRVKGYKNCILRSEICPYLMIDKDYGQIVQSLGRNMRSNLRSQARQVEEKHGMSFKSPKTVEEVPGYIGELFKLHDSRFKIKKKKSAFSHKQIKEFHCDVAKYFFLRSWLKMYFLQQDDKAVACLYAFRYKDRLFSYQAGFNQVYGNLSLGSILIGHAIEKSIAGGVKEFHFLRGNEQYKKRWTKTYLVSKTVMVVNNTSVGRFFEIRANIKQTIKYHLGKSNS